MNVIYQQWKLELNCSNMYRQLWVWGFKSRIYWFWYKIVTGIEYWQRWWL